MDSKFGELKTKDFWEGLVMAGFTSAVSTIGTAAAMVVDFASFEWITLIKALGIGAIIGFCSHISKHLFTNSDGEPLKKEVK